MPSQLYSRLKVLQEVESLLWGLDAKLADAGLPENDKLRNLTSYAWQEAQAQLGTAQQAISVPPTREELWTGG